MRTAAEKSKGMRKAAGSETMCRLKKGEGQKTLVERTRTGAPGFASTSY